MESRRKFIRNTSILIAATPFFGIISCKKKKYRKCATTEDILGPYYRESAPTRINLITNNQDGVKLNLTGTVYGDNCETPIANAKIEIWHANDAGDYDNDTDDFEFRASTTSNDEGVYSFDTIVPGKYLNGGSYRPSHIHYKITADNHEELITQLYFEGDEDIAEDNWASTNDAQERIIALSDNLNSGKDGVFDITLAPD